MFRHYLDQEDKGEMLRRRKQIEDQSQIVESLRQSFNIWFVKKLAKYKLDPARNWVLNPQTGQITEAKEPKQ